MRYLLDTHAVLWLRNNDPRINRLKWENVLFDPENEVMVSIVSFWEIAIKRGIGKLSMDGSLEEFGRSLVTQQGFQILPIELSHLSRYERLPRHHGDPFDRLLIAQAIECGATAITDDPQWKAYPVKRNW